MESQHARLTFRDNDIGANGQYTLHNLGELEPAGGISRTEEAELVVLVIHGMRVEWDQAVTTQAAGLRAGFEISRDDQPGPLTEQRTVVYLSNIAYNGDAPGAAALSRQAITSDPDVLWFGMGKGEAGANAEKFQAYFQNHIRPFRDWFGEGPVFLGSDELNVHSRVNVINREVNWVADIQFSAYWEVRDKQ